MPLRILVSIIIFVLLTLLTQIGGLVYVVCVVAARNIKRHKRIKLLGLFLGIYLLATLVLVPLLAPVFGRERIHNTEFVQPHSVWYGLLNRNYVKPELNKVIATIGKSLNERATGVQLIYLDACFPFIDGFPLLPHLSHNDGKKLDITFIYKDGTGAKTNSKRSRTGYGIYEGPFSHEFNQCDACKEVGYVQYDLPKYLTFGEVNKDQDLSLDEYATKQLIQIIVAQETVGKLFIEPHLKTRMQLKSDKVRFQGCRAVRHDDHIHLQLR